MEWFKQNFKQAVLIALLTVFLSTIGSLIVFSVSTKDTKLDKAASVEYVDKKDSDQKLYIDMQDGIITQRLNRVQEVQQTKADKDDVDKLFQLCIENNKTAAENNKLLIEVLSRLNSIK